MKIIVCIKQIPDTNDVKWSKDNNIIREGTISILNPQDKFAILSALELKKTTNAEVTLLSMGPMNAKNSIEYGLSFGADRGVLLSDKKFAAADTLSTAKTLYYAVKYLGGADLILTGQFASDGDTAQTPYSLATLLNIPHIGYVRKILKQENNEITVKSIKDDGEYEIKSKTPLVLSISGYEGEIKEPLARDYIRAQSTKTEILSAEDINANLNEIGIKGSPTYVSKASRPNVHRDCKFVDVNFLIEDMCL